MLVIRNERTIWVDVDETLVMHVRNGYVCDPNELIAIPDAIENRDIIMRINRPMVRLYKEEIARGAVLLVHSKGGYAWAESVVKALNLVHDNVIVMTKATAYFDDKDVSEWLKDRVYFKPDDIYKP